MVYMRAIDGGRYMHQVLLCPLAMRSRGRCEPAAVGPATGTGVACRLCAAAGSTSAHACGPCAGPGAHCPACMCTMHCMCAARAEL